LVSPILFSFSASTKQLKSKVAARDGRRKDDGATTRLLAGARARPRVSAPPSSGRETVPCSQLSTGKERRAVARVVIPARRHAATGSFLSLFF
jgi:hypothetical protein